MNRYFILSYIFLGFYFVGNAQKVIISGKLDLKSPVDKVFLDYKNGNNRVTDSVLVVNGAFKIVSEISEATIATFSVRYKTAKKGKDRIQTERLQIFIEPGEMKVSAHDSLKRAIVKGSESQESFEKLNEMLRPYDNRNAELNLQFESFNKAKDLAGMQKVREESYNLKREKDTNVYQRFVWENPNSPVSLYIIERKIVNDLNPLNEEPLYNSLSAGLKNTASGKAISNRLKKARRTSVGAIAPEFSQNDVNGKPVSLSSFRGKYVLIDFWASWCGPCRQENPNVVNAYNKYKDKNFTVLGISLDMPGKKDNWLSAIKTDGLEWTQLSDLKFWDNEVAKLYGIRAIPQNFLIDPTGKIIAKNIRGEELNKKLQEVLE